MMDIPASDPRAVTVVTAIRNGEISKLQSLLDADPKLATARNVDERAVGRTLLHIVADWPGHYPEAARTAELLARHGADVNAWVQHPDVEQCRETPLHWAASNDDVALIDALLDAGAGIEAPGAIFTGGAPMSDAVVFAQWNAARRLLERGAKTTFWQSAALGLLDDVRKHFGGESAPSGEEITGAFWNACRGGQRDVAEFLLAHGADRNWLGYDDKTPLAVALESGNGELVDWLRDHGAK
ncbi:MAG TPA: ankyrin repeat domain-containing protein [Thermoanaerobaculia bacterium]